MLSPAIIKLKSALGASACLALAACASLPPATPARVAEAPEAYAAGRSLEAPAAPWPQEAWWTRYGDPQLDAIMSEALAGSPSLAQAAARIVRAQADHAAARAAELPALSGNASAQEQKFSHQYIYPPQYIPAGYEDYGQATLNLNWELDFWGKYRAAIAAASSRARAAAADAAEARLVLTTDIATAYATLIQLEADRDVTADSVKVRDETAGLVRQRVANGLDTQGELKQAAAAAPATQAGVAEIDEEIALTRDEIAALMGAGPDRGLAIQRPAAPPLAAFGLPASLKADLVGRRPDVAAARWRAEAAARDVKVARAQFYPDIDLTGYVGQQSLHLSQLFVPGAGMGAIGPAVSLPIFQGGRLRAGLRGAEADRDAAVAAYDETVTTAFRQVADAAASRRALTTRLDQARQALTGYEAAWRIARLRYEGGLSTYQAVLLAEDSALSQRRAVADLESRAFVLDVALVRALGGGFRQTS